MSFCRVDRLATLYFFYPLIRKINSDRGMRIPILMYHSISEKSDHHLHPYFQTTTSPQVFSAQMRFLHEHNYTVIGLDQAVLHLAALQSNKEQRFVVLTFDDGYRNFYTEVFPLLQEYGSTATVFLPTRFIGEEPIHFQGTSCLSWSQVRELYRYGVSFGSHSVNHSHLRGLDESRLTYEVAHSKDIIEQKLGKSVESFSYPFAFPEQDRAFTRKLKSLLEDSGYRNGVSTTVGTASVSDDLLFLKRIPINSGDDLQFFGAKLEGAYDWLRPLQYIRKRVGSR